MGANAAGKTSLGKALLRIFKFINSGNTALLLDMAAPNAIGKFTIDFVNQGYVMHRLSASIDSATSSITLTHAQAAINERDTYDCYITSPALRSDQAGYALCAAAGALDETGLKRIGQVRAAQGLQIAAAAAGPAEPEMILPRGLLVLGMLLLELHRAHGGERIVDVAEGIEVNVQLVIPVPAAPMKASFS